MGKQSDYEFLRQKLSESRVRLKGSGLYLTVNEAVEFKKNFCAGCGGKKHNPRKYFGEEFCGTCVEKWSRGSR